MRSNKISKVKMTKDTIPEDFTLTLALADAVPVLFFSATMLLVGLLFRSPLFLIGAGLVLFAGAANWLEQSTNGVAQIAFFVGVLLIVLGI